MNGQIPRQAGDYELLEMIGNGAQGQVFRARRAGEPGSACAVKILASRDDDSSASFRRSIGILRGLSHPNVVRYFDVFPWRDGPDEKTCLVTELLDGETLQAKIDRAPEGLDWETVESVFRQCFAGLACSIGMGVLHGDIKPSNIFVQRDGTVKLIDFDIARRVDVTTASAKDRQGSFDYMAPDFVSMAAFSGDEQSGVFSLGVCFYHAVTGRLPFPRLDEPANIAYARRWQDAHKPAFSLYAPGFRILTREAREFARDSLCLDRAKRYAGFAPMRDAFGRIGRRRVAGSSDEYELLSVLGRGGFGEVYKARRLRDGKMLAVKWLFVTHQSRRSLREARLLKKSRHEHIVEYVDFVEIPEVSGQTTYFLVMEFLEGMPEWTLRNRVTDSPGGLPVREALELFIHYLEALQYLHDMHVIHRDIKPANLYAPAGKPAAAKLFDLGVARDIKGTVTTGRVPGTLNYMPPELTMAGKERGSPRSDVYSTGLSLYEALTGRRVFLPLPEEQGAAFREFMDRSRPETADSVNYALRPFVEYPALAGILRKAIAPDPEDRFASADLMREALAAVLAEAGTGIAETVAPDDGHTRSDMPTLSTMHSSDSRAASTPSRNVLSGSGSGLGSVSAARRRRLANAIAVAAACAAVAVVVATAVRPRTEAKAPRREAASVPAAAPTPAAETVSKAAPPAPAATGETAPPRAAAKDEPGLPPPEATTPVAPAPEPVAAPPSPAGAPSSPAPRAPEPDAAAPAPAQAGTRVVCDLAGVDNPRASLEYRQEGSPQWEKLPSASSSVELPPGKYVFRLTRPDYEPVERGAELRPGMKEFAVPAPDRWTEKAALASLRKLERAWKERAPNSAALDAARNGTAPDFEWRVHSERYRSIVAEWERSEKASLPGRVLAAEKAVDEYARWLYQVKDPVSGGYRRFREEPPDIAGPLAAVPGRPAPEPSDRLLAWKAASANLRAEPGRKALADALSALAKKMRADSPAKALQCDFESALLRSRPGALLPGFDGGADHAQALGQRAHAAFAPQGSCMDSLKCMERYARAGGRADRYDVHLAILAAAYTWKNAVEGEQKYAVAVNDLLAAVLGRLDEAAAAEAVTHLEQSILGNRAADDDPCMYAMEALSFMPGLPDSSGLKPAAKRWLAANGGKPPVAAKRASIRDSVTLLRDLLNVPSQ